MSREWGARSDCSRRGSIALIHRDARAQHAASAAHPHLLQRRSRKSAYDSAEQLNGGGYLAKYGKAAAKTVKSAMHRKKKGTLKSGSGGKVKSRKQAIAIGLNEARKKGAKVPRKATRK